MHRDSWRINRIGTTNVFTASRHTIIPSFDRSSIRHYYFNCLFLHWRETCKPSDVIKSKWPREEMSPMIMCLCEVRRRKVKVRWKNLQSKHNHQYYRIILGNFFISFHRHFKFRAYFFLLGLILTVTVSGLRPRAYGSVVQSFKMSLSIYTLPKFQCR